VCKSLSKIVFAPSSQSDFPKEKRQAKNWETFFSNDDDDDDDDDEKKSRTCEFRQQQLLCYRILGMLSAATALFPHLLTSQSGHHITTQWSSPNNPNIPKSRLGFWFKNKKYKFTLKFLTQNS
jgi:hypothetical protein